MFVQENFGRREQHLEQHYNDVLQTLSQRYDERASGLQEEKKAKLESLYSQLLVCGQALDASKELIETAQEIYRCQDKRLFLKVPHPREMSPHNLLTQTKLNHFIISSKCIKTTADVLFFNIKASCLIDFLLIFVDRQLCPPLKGNHYAALCGCML